MSLKFATVKKVTEPTEGNLRLANDETTSHYKFIGSQPLSLQEMTDLVASVGAGDVVVETYVSKRSGYKYKTTLTTTVKS